MTEPTRLSLVQGGLRPDPTEADKVRACEFWIRHVDDVEKAPPIVYDGQGRITDPPDVVLDLARQFAEVRAGLVSSEEERYAWDRYVEALLYEGFEVDEACTIARKVLGHRRAQFGGGGR